MAEDIPQWFIDFIEQVKKDIGIDASIAREIARIDSELRGMRNEHGEDLERELAEVVASDANPRMIEEIWNTAQDQ